MRHKLYERFGRFVISKSDMDALPDWLQQLMARVIVIKAQYDVRSDGTEYFALSPEFERGDPSSFCETYRPIIDGNRFLRWSR